MIKSNPRNKRFSYKGEGRCRSHIRLFYRVKKSPIYKVIEIPFTDRHPLMRNVDITRVEVIKVTERELELMLVKEVKRRGGRAFKFISPGINGVPDRLVLMPLGKIGFVEVKAPGKKMRPTQITRKGELESLGFLVYCLDDPEKIGGVVDDIERSL